MMQTPPDYPVDQPDAELTDKHAANAQITFGALRNRVLANKPVTDDMINAARLKLECAYEAVDDIDNTESSETIESKLSALTKRLRIPVKTGKL